MFINIADMIVATDVISRIVKSHDCIGGKRYYNITIEYKNGKSSVLGFKLKKTGI